MNINRDNYESWFLDYLDGTLDAGQKEKLMSFLDFNPDLKTELEGMELINLDAENVSYQNKEILKRPDYFTDTEIGADKFETLCISAIENQLSGDEETVLNDLLKNDPEKRQEYVLFESTLLKADKNITYPQKSLLRKRFIDLPRVRIAVSIAAATAVILLAISGLFRDPEGNELISDNPEIATPGNTEPKEKTNEIISTEGLEQVANNYLAEQTDSKTLESHIEPAINQREPSKSLGPDSNPQLAHDIQPDIQPDIPTDLHSSLISLKPREAEFLTHEKEAEQGIIAYNLLDNSSSRTDYPAQKEKERKIINFWKLADSGLQKINELSEEDYSLVREVDDQGQTRRFTFESPIFGISTPMGNPSPSQ